MAPILLLWWWRWCGGSLGWRGAAAHLRTRAASGRRPVVDVPCGSTLEGGEGRRTVKVGGGLLHAGRGPSAAQRTQGHVDGRSACP